MSVPRHAISASYASCRRVTRRAASNFVPCFLVLPRGKRRAMHALYAFMRHTDDLADNRRPVDARRQDLARWRAMLDEVFSANAEGRIAAKPKPPSAAPGIFDPHGSSEWHRRHASGTRLLPALADAVHRFAIPTEHLYTVIDGVEMDLAQRYYKTFDELAEYCHRVASAVGLACIHIWGFRGDQAMDRARKCGLALQLTNILRDLREDAERGRIYLPLEDLDRCGYSPEDLTAGVVDERFSRLMMLQIDRVRRFYRQGAELIRWLEPDGQRIFGMMTSIYHRLLEELERRQDEIFVRRIGLSRWQKLAITARWALLPPRRSALP